MTVKDILGVVKNEKFELEGNGGAWSSKAMKWLPFWKYCRDEGHLYKEVKRAWIYDGKLVIEV